LPFLFGKFFHHLLQLLVVGYGLAHPILPGTGNKKLAESAATTLHKIKRDVRLTPGTAAPGFSALPAANRQCPPQQVPKVDDLSPPRAAAAIERLHGRSAQQFLLSLE
jgi:hypothetical protein